MILHFQPMLTVAVMFLILFSKVLSDKSPMCSVIQGLPGLNGRDGRDGVNGFKGDPGPAGAPGTPGIRGANGPPGKAGPSGSPGNKGVKGDNGPAGTAGAKGATGAKGDKGDSGVKGDNGPAGTAGAKGATGAKGDKGDSDTVLAKRVTDLEYKVAALEKRLSSLKNVLKLEGMIQEAGKKIMATNGKLVDFETSASTCKALGGHIATPMNEAENNAIMEFVKKHNSYAYLGIKEGTVPNTFTYLRGIPVVYTHWAIYEPSGKGQESCVEMYTDGTWNDKPCNYNRLTICEL